MNDLINRLVHAFAPDILQALRENDAFKATILDIVKNEGAENGAARIDIDDYASDIMDIVGREWNASDHDYEISEIAREAIDVSEQVGESLIEFFNENSFSIEPK